ncbi:hypothetical protein PPACK8108_LOCUS3964 [Phakopsora pachyrhizi]|uniref:Uncharacterized protein n=1 Tax=Phakopsora pachyrhizi TaxID=170000 RepID=A0AAV0ANR3_PHAPC|nr:hypothetical protein PPACK8108_LOCUS3964 [Phakopsora pachyrhizi]
MLQHLQESAADLDSVKSEEHAEELLEQVTSLFSCKNEPSRTSGHVPKNWANVVVSIHAIVTFQAFNDYLRPRIIKAQDDERLGCPSGSGRLSGMLAAFAAVAGLPAASSSSQTSQIEEGGTRSSSDLWSDICRYPNKFPCTSTEFKIKWAPSSSVALSSSAPEELMEIDITRRDQMELDDQRVGSAFNQLKMDQRWRHIPTWNSDLYSTQQPSSLSSWRCSSRPFIQSWWPVHTPRHTVYGAMLPLLILAPERRARLTAKLNRQLEEPMIVASALSSGLGLANTLALYTEERDINFAKFAIRKLRNFATLQTSQLRNFANLQLRKFAKFATLTKFAKFATLTQINQDHWVVTQREIGGYNFASLQFANFATSQLCKLCNFAIRKLCKLCNFAKLQPSPKFAKVCNPHPNQSRSLGCDQREKVCKFANLQTLQSYTWLRKLCNFAKFATLTQFNQDHWVVTQREK